MSEQNISAAEEVENLKDLVHPDELNKENVIGSEKLTSRFGFSSAADEPMDYVEEEGEEQIVFKDLNNVCLKIPCVEEDDTLDYDEMMDTDSSVDSPKKISKLLYLSGEESDSHSDDFVPSTGNQVKSFSDSLNSVSNTSFHGSSAAVGAAPVSTENEKKDTAADPSKTDPAPELEDGELNCEEDELVVIRPPKLAGDLEVSEKLKERAKRFGLKISEIRISEDILVTLYSSFGIPFHHVRSGQLTTVRLNTIHMYGVGSMTIADILYYFDRYNPQSVERISDYTCNILFGSDLSAARAMLGTSFDEPVKSGSRLSPADSDEKEAEKGKVSRQSQQKENGESSDAEEKVLSSLPPGIWRRGYSGPKSKLILLRFATVDDISVDSNKNKRKPYPFYEGTSGLISSSKKKRIMAPQNDRNYYSLGNRLAQQRSRTWSKPRRQSHYSDEEESSWAESHSSSTYKRRERHVPSYEKKFPHFERRVRGHSEENTVYAGNKPVYMTMYADSVEGSWQTVKPQPEESSQLEEKKNEPLNEASGYASSSVQQASQSNPRRVIPSRYKVWNPIAEDMVKDSELAEELEYYGPRYQKLSRPDDLRSKLQVSSTAYQRPTRYFENSGGEDLRTKLQNLRSEDSESRHRSPLLIKVSK